MLRTRSSLTAVCSGCVIVNAGPLLASSQPPMLRICGVGHRVYAGGGEEGEHRTGDAGGEVGELNVPFRSNLTAREPRRIQ